MKQDDLHDLIIDVLRRAPKWVRSELSSSDDMMRERAEETLGAMMTAAVASMVAIAAPTGRSESSGGLH